jgi:hypothetical protein
MSVRDGFFAPIFNNEFIVSFIIASNNGKSNREISNYNYCSTLSLIKFLLGGNQLTQEGQGMVQNSSFNSRY